MATALTASADALASPAPISLADLAPARQRPLQWKRLREQLAIMWVADPSDVLDAAYSIGDALGGMSDERQLGRLLDSAQGQASLAERSSLTEALADHAALRALPEGSLGREFLHFSERHGLDARKLIERQHAMSRDFDELDAVRQWASDRFTVMHDLWHVLAGYDATHAGESALMCFSLPQRVNDRALPIFVVMALLSRRLSVGNALEAFRCGRGAKLLAAEGFETLLPLPLATARERLGILPPSSAHKGRVSEGMLIPEANPQA